MWEWIAPLFSDILCASFVHSPKTSVFIRASHSNMSWQSWTTVRSTRSIGNRWWTSKAASESFSTTASFGCTPGMSVTHSARPFFVFPRSLDFDWRFTSPKFGAAIKYHHVISGVYRVFMGFLCSKSMSVHVSPAGPSEWWWIPQGALTSPLRSQCPWWLKWRETTLSLLK